MLNPPVADLALFDVSPSSSPQVAVRQFDPLRTIKLGRIIELSRIADAFQAAGVSRATLLRIKAFAGRLDDLISLARTVHEHVAALITEARAMEACTGLRSGSSPSQYQPAIGSRPSRFLRLPEQV